MSRKNSKGTPATTRGSKGGDAPGTEVTPYRERPLPRTDLTMKIALLDCYGWNAREIADEVKCSHAHVRNLRTHPEFRKLMREFFDGKDFDGSLAFKVYGQKVARRAIEALDAVGDQLSETMHIEGEDGEMRDTGLPQPQIRQGAAKVILDALGRHVAAHARAVAPTAGASTGGAVTVHLHVGDDGTKVIEVIDQDAEEVEADG